MFFYSAISTTIILSTIPLINYVRTNKLKINKFAFSERNYYILLSGFIVGILIQSILQNSYKSFIVFIIFGIAGVIGETLFSIWWHTFFGKRFFVYSVDTLMHSYTSTLNFVPWAIGGYIYLEISKVVIGREKIIQIFQNLNTYYYVFGIFFLIIFLEIIVFYTFIKARLPESKFHKVTFFNFIFIFFSLFYVIFYFVFYFGNEFIVLTILFGLIAVSLEYLFGKATQFFISKKMWIYSYGAIDKGHFTPFSIPAFIMAGYYFLLVGEFILQYLKF